MKAINLSIEKKGNHIYKKYKVEHKGKKDTILYTQDDRGVRFEPYNGNFSEKEFGDICKFLWEEEVETFIRNLSKIILAD